MASSGHNELNVTRSGYSFVNIIITLYFVWQNLHYVIVFLYFILFSFSQATTKLFLNNEFVESKTNDWIPLHNPVS